MIILMHAVILLGKNIPSNKQTIYFKGSHVVKQLTSSKKEGYELSHMCWAQYARATS